MRHKGFYRTWGLWLMLSGGMIGSGITRFIFGVEPPDLAMWLITGIFGAAGLVGGLFLTAVLKRKYEGLSDAEERKCMSIEIIVMIGVVLVSAIFSGVSMNIE